MTTTQELLKNIKTGDMIKIIDKKKTYIGTLMPKSELSAKNIIVLKLENGYNVGLEITKDTKIEIIKKSQTTTNTKKQKIDINPKKQTIAILHTGGTIASKVDYKTGAVSASFSPEDLLNMFPELKNIANFRSKLIANAFSENLQFAHYNMFIDSIVKEIKQGVDGIILTQGTDTIGYTAAALAFVLENVSIPILIVGAQKSSDRGSSDAAMNIICATQFITKTKFAGVAVCMHDTMNDTACAILPATKTRKMHTSRRDAFKPINLGKIATVDSVNGNVIFNTKNYETKNSSKKLVVKKFKSVKVGILRAHPGLLDVELDTYINNNFDGLVIEGTGLGHLNVIAFDDESKSNELVFKKLEKFIASNGVVAMTSQAPYGRINMDVYSAGRKLITAGVLGNLCDMLPETAYIKLAWLLSNYKLDDVKKLYGTNLRGEITTRIKADFFEK